MKLLLTFFFLFSFLVVFQPDYILAASEARASVDYEHVGRILEKQTPLTAEERKWFEDFLEGTFLAEGWNEITNDILAKIKKQDQESQLLVLQQLGHKIGREWVKDNGTRKINTAMLRQWGAKLKKAADQYPERLVEVIGELHQEVDSVLKPF